MKPSDYCWCSHQVRWHSRTENRSPQDCSMHIYTCRWCAKRVDSSDDGHEMASKMPMWMKREAADTVGEALNPTPVYRSDLFTEIEAILLSIPSDHAFWVDGSFDRLVVEIRRISREKQYGATPAAQKNKH